VAAQKEVTVEFRPATVEEVVPFISRAGRFNTSGGEFDPVKVAQIGPAYMLEIEGRQIGAYVLEVRGAEVRIIAAGAAGEVDFTKVGLSIIEAQAREHCEYVSFSTKRPGLIRKATKLGYEVAGVIMRKKLK
jgi:hypothetical protein